MAGPKMYGGNKIPSQSPPKVAGGQMTDNGESSKGGGHAPLYKHMAQHGFTVGGSSGPITVADGGWNNGMGGGSDTNATPLTNTDMTIGSRKRPPKPKNMYCSGDSVT